MELVEKKIFKYVCSFGNCCHSSQLLKKNKLQKCSYPFDWIFSNSDMITHCMEDEFTIFLSKSHYKSCSKSVCDHEYYKKNYDINTMFRHFNPLEDKSAYNYYKRCVDRFKLMMKNSEPKLFVQIYINSNPQHLEEIKLNSIEFEKKINEFAKNYTLLVIININNNCVSTQSYIKYSISNIDFLELYTVSESNGLGFMNECDNIYLDNIIAHYYTFDLA